MEGHNLEIPGVWRVLKAKILKVKYEAKLEFTERGLNKKPSVGGGGGGVSIFSGTTHFHSQLTRPRTPFSLCRTTVIPSGM